MAGGTGSSLPCPQYANSATSPARAWPRCSRNPLITASRVASASTSRAQHRLGAAAGDEELAERVDVVATPVEAR